MFQNRPNSLCNAHHARDNQSCSSHNIPLDKAGPARVLITDDNKRFTSEVDPADIDAGLTQHYLDIFFDQINIPVFNVLPRSPFMTWALNCTCKSLQDRIMLYALMTCASLHCVASDSADDRAVFKAIVYQEIGSLESCRGLQSVHALFFLAVAEYGDHQYQAGSIAFSKCVDTMTLLELDVEQKWKQELGVYELPAVTDEECRRRTFWAVFCFNSHLRLHDLSLQRIDQSGISISLPCENDLYNLERPSHRYCFAPDRRFEPSIAAEDTNILSEMAHMIEITRIHADINSHLSRSAVDLSSSNQDPNVLLDRKGIEARLELWADNYGDVLQTMKASFYDAQNERRDSRQSYSRTRSIAGLNILYYSSQMVLNRRLHHRGLSDSELLSHARKATTNALDVLRLAEHVTARKGSGMRDHLFVLRGFATVYAIFEAVDIVTAVGRVVDFLEPGSRIMSLVYNALDLLDRLGSWWGHDFVRYKEVERRVQTVLRFTEAASKARKTFFYCSSPIQGTVSRDFDLIYGTDRKTYIGLAYFHHTLIDETDIFEIDTR